jgi:hypothetical protein
MSADLSRRTATVLLGVILAYALVANGWFVLADRRPCNINELSHVMGPVDFLYLLPHRPSVYSAYLEAFHGYPPIGLVASAFYALFGRQHDAAVFSQFVFTLALLTAVFHLGARLANRRVGLLAAWLLAVSPAPVELTRQYLLEWPLTAFSVLATWFLLASDSFINKRLAIAAGLAVGAAALSKQTFFLFLAGPVLWFLPQWLKAIREEAPATVPPDRPRWRWAKIAGTALVAFGVSWLLYGPAHRAVIENWFAAHPQFALPYTWIFFAATAVLLLLIGYLAWGRSTPLRNGLLALLVMLVVASLWYFPKGLLNFLTYLAQMRLNVATSGMSPASLLVFYRAHLTTYYLGMPTWLAVAGAAAALLAMAATRRWLRRWFYLPDAAPKASSMLLLLLWVGVPFGAFFFINIQNEMNTVPMTPPLALLAAVVIDWVRLPMGARGQKALQTGSRILRVRVMRGLADGWRYALIAVVILGGVLMTLPWPDGKGGYAPLPGLLNRPRVIELGFARKNNPIGYMTPQIGDWHEWDVAHALFDALPVTVDGQDAPRVLAMDVEFYFSWNTFWYLAKLMDKRVEIRAPWIDDANILDPASPDYVQKFDRLLYRTAATPIYEESKVHNDYQNYRHLLIAFNYLNHPPPELDLTHPVLAIFPLPDGTTAVVRGRASR